MSRLEKQPSVHDAALVQDVQRSRVMFVATQTVIVLVRLGTHDVHREGVQEGLCRRVALAPVWQQC